MHWMESLCQQHWIYQLAAGPTVNSGQDSQHSGRKREAKICNKLKAKMYQSYTTNLVS